MNIGKPKRTIQVEPVEPPVPTEAPLPVEEPPTTTPQPIEDPTPSRSSNVA
jgi:hypothetical protein